MALSLATQHRQRVERLVAGIKAYALEAGISEATASRRVLNQSHELTRLQVKGTLKPETLQKREKALRECRAALRRSPVHAESAA